MPMRRRLALTLLPLAACSALFAALLVALDVAESEQYTAGTPAEVEKREFAPVPEPERAPYTPAEAAAVAVVDEAVPAIQSGTIVAELQPHDLPGFELLGVTWTGGVPVQGAEVQVRWRQEGTWSSWTRLDIDSQEVEGGVPGTEPKWVGPSDAAQARVVAEGHIDPAGLTLVTVAPGESATLTQAAAAQPGIITRGQWGSRSAGGCDSPRYGTMQGTIVHHTAGSNNYTAAQSAGIVRSIQAYHMDGQKWCDTGYNFLIDRYGQVFEGRAGGIQETPRGAHAGNFDVNLNTTGISLMGTFVNDVPPAAMKDAAVRLTAWRHSLKGVPAKGTYSMGGKVLNRIAGHYNVTSTACPGAQTINWMNAPGGMRDQVEQAMDGYSVYGGIGSYWNANGGASGSIGAPTSAQVAAGSGALQRFQHADLWWRADLGVTPVRGAIRTEFRYVGENASGLAWPMGPEYSITGGAYQDFSGGRIFAKPGVGTFAIAEPMYSAHEAIGNVGGALGWPTNRAVPYGSGSLQKFERGTIYARESSVIVVPGGFDTAYVAAGGPAGSLGWPKSGVIQSSTGAYVQFEGGLVQQTATGMRTVAGMIGRTYQASGGAAGLLGLPTSAERSVGDGFVQDFEGGQIQCWPGATVVMPSSVAALQKAAGGPLGSLGWPTGRVVDEPGGFRQDFQGGVVYGSSSSTRVGVVRGGLLTVYRGHDGPRAVGYPTGAEFKTDVAWKQVFERGAAYLPLNGMPGSLVSGRIWEAYVAAGADGNANLGYPLGPAVGTVDGATRQVFSSSTFFTTGTGTFVVRGFLRTMFSQYGAEGGRLRLPLESERALGVGATQRFGGGTLWVSPAGAAATWGAMQTEYLRRGGPEGSLGWPVGSEVYDGRVWTQRFQKGTLVLDPATGFSVR